MVLSFPSFTTATRIMRDLGTFDYLGNQHKRDNNGLNHELGILWIAPKGFSSLIMKAN